METFICVEKLGEKYKNPSLMRDLHFPLVLTKLVLLFKILKFK